MMPFIQGDPNSLPEIYKPYSEIIRDNYLQKGEIGFLTLHESFVEANKSQRGYNSKGIDRNIHIEVGHTGSDFYWGSSGGSSWGGKKNAILAPDTEVLIANSLSDTCKYWPVKELRPTPDGDLSDYINDYPEDTGVLLKAGEVAKISIFTPHEVIAQKVASIRQFFRIVGRGVTGREPYFTINPILNQ